MPETLKVGIIGVGGIAHAHMPGWEAFDQTEVIAVSDINPTVAEQFAQRYNVPSFTTQADDLFNNPNIDIIDICTPNNFHAPLAISAFQAGKHVICEKPLAPTPKEIEAMIEVRDASGKMLMTAQHFRFSGIAKAMKAQIGFGALGEVYHARSWMLRRSLIPNRLSFILKNQASGGACIDIGVHILDLTLWMMGNPEPVSVTGVSRTELATQDGAFTTIWNGGDIPKEIDVEEFASAFVRFENGATLILEVSWMLHHETEGEDVQVWLYGKDGGAHFPSGKFLSSNNVTKQHYNTKLKVMGNYLEPHAQECVEFAQAILDGAPSPVPAEQSLQVAKILDAVYRSQETGREIRLDED